MTIIINGGYYYNLCSLFLTDSSGKGCKGSSIPGGCSGVLTLAEAVHPEASHCPKGRGLWGSDIVGGVCRSGGPGSAVADHCRCCWPGGGVV